MTSRTGFGSKALMEIGAGCAHQPLLSKSLQLHLFHEDHSYSHQCGIVATPDHVLQEWFVDIEEELVANLCRAMATPRRHPGEDLHPALLL